MVLMEDEQHVWPKEENDIQLKSVKPLSSIHDQLNTLHATKNPVQTPKARTAKNIDLPPILLPPMTEPLQRSPNHPMRPFLQLKSPSTNELLRRQLHMEQKRRQHKEQEEPQFCSPEQFVVSNNADSEKVLATVVKAVEYFLIVIHLLLYMQQEVQNPEPDFIRWE